VGGKKLHFLHLHGHHNDFAHVFIFFLVNYLTIFRQHVLMTSHLANKSQAWQTPSYSDHYQHLTEFTHTVLHHGQICKLTMKSKPNYQ